MKKMYNRNYIRQLFAENLKRLRTSNRLNQSELAEKIDMSANMISEMENGKKWPSDDTVAKLANAYKCEPHSFFLPMDKWEMPIDEIYKENIMDGMAASLCEQGIHCLATEKKFKKE